MLDKTIISILVLTFSVAVMADSVKVNPDHPDKYVVVKGDTLWSIAGRFLDKPWQWPEIWSVNPQMENPNLIYPGDVIFLTYEAGAPVLNVERGSNIIARDRNAKLSPQIRSSEHTEAISSIPIDVIQQFLKRPLVLDEDEMADWPYVMSVYDKMIASTGSTVYVRGIPKDDNTRFYSIYRRGKPYVNPSNEGGKKEILGYEAIYVGDAVIEKTGDPASALITKIGREILSGDRLVPQSDDGTDEAFIPKPINHEVGGQVLSVVDGISMTGRYQVIVLNLGLEQGLELGDVLGIYKRGATATDTIGSAHDVLELPEEYIGAAMVFRTFKKVSYALVMESENSVKVLDVVKNM